VVLPVVVVMSKDTKPTGGGWRIQPCYIVLSCPTCRRTVQVLPGCSGWCTRCPGRPEMREELSDHHA